MSNKVVVHTETGELRINDKCLILKNDMWLVAELLSLQTSNEDITKFYCKFPNTNTYECTYEIKAIPKPVPLVEYELAEKLNEFKCLGWWMKSDTVPFIEASMSTIFVRNLSSSVSIEVNRVDVSEVSIRAPKSNVWIRAIEVTEDTGKIV